MPLGSQQQLLIDETKSTTNNKKAPGEKGRQKKTGWRLIECSPSRREEATRALQAASCPSATETRWRAPFRSSSVWAALASKTAACCSIVRSICCCRTDRDDCCIRWPLAIRWQRSRFLAAFSLVALNAARFSRAFRLRCLAALQASAALSDACCALSTLLCASLNDVTYVSHTSSGGDEGTRTE